MLKTLELVQAPKHTKDPFDQAKTVLLDKLDAQLHAVNLMVNRKPSTLKDRQKWYYKIDDVMYLKLKVKNKVLVLKEDKNKTLDRVQIGEDKNAPTVVQQVIEAVQKGELDQVIRDHIK